MSFKPLTESEFRRIGPDRYKFKVESDIADFVASDAKYGQLDCSAYKSTKTLCTTYLNAINRMGLKNQVHVTQAGGNVFLIKVAGIGDEA